MTSLPASSDFTGGAVTEGQFKTALTSQRDFLAGLLGSDGTVATALATLGALLSSVADKTAAYTITLGDRGRLITASGAGGWTLSLPAAATAGAGFAFSLRNGSSASITIDPNAAELINGASTLLVGPARGGIVICTGTAWLVIGMTGHEAFSVAGGTPASPGMFFITDADTGFTNPNSGQIGIISNGVLAAVFDPVGTDAPNATTAITREKGDARYPRLATSNTFSQVQHISSISPHFNLNDTDGVVGGSNYGRITYQSGGVITGDIGHNGTIVGAMSFRSYNGDVDIWADALNAAANSRVRFIIDNVSAATVDPAGTATVGGLTVMTREKGDARYVRSSLIVGTVSQAAGVPTGALLESATNANGRYERRADGVQECWVSMAASAAAAASWTFPAAFIEEPRVKGNAIATVASSVVLDAAPTTTAATFSARDKTDARRADIVHLHAIGRWSTMT